ncbi:MAG: FAD:protein FMN transferase [Saprospiraceae bacterium]
MRGFIFVIILLCSTIIFGQSLQTHKKVLKLMGCRFEVTAVALNDTVAWEAIRAGIVEMERIEKLISSWDKNSQTSKINRQAGIQPVKVDKELFDLIRRAKSISELTGGAFDISFASMDRIWKFDGSMQKMPNAEVVKNAADKINWQDIIADAELQTIFLKRENMKIGFGAIGKGYAANRAMQIMKRFDIEGGVVNASGDLISWGKSENPSGWNIKIADPKDKYKVLGILETNNLAVVTSGDYEKFVTFENQRYAHIIDPRTGYPTTGIKSVTIICPDAEVADALATSVFVLGRKEGLNLINQLKSVEGLIVTDEDEVFTSKKLVLENL